MDFDLHMHILAGSFPPNKTSCSIRGPTTTLAATTKPPRYILNSGKDGLPIAEGKRPDWLLKEDELILDARRLDAIGGLGVIGRLLAQSCTCKWKLSSRMFWILRPSSWDVRFFQQSSALTLVLFRCVVLGCMLPVGSRGLH